MIPFACVYIANQSSHSSGEPSPAQQREADKAREEWRTRVLAEEKIRTETTYSPRSDSSDGYREVLGNLWVGTKLYDKRTHEFFGTVKDIRGSTVEVLVARMTEIRRSTASVYSVEYPRSHITSNYVTK